MPAAFPASSVTDDFNRANGAPGGLWTPDPAGADAPEFTIASNQMVGSAAFAWMYYDLALGGRAEARMKIGAYSAGTAELELIVNPGTTSWGGYAVSTDGTDSFIYRYGINSADGGLDALPAASFAAGDEMGIRVLAGGLVEFWAKPAAGSWSMILDAVDPSPITGDFYAAMYSSNTSTGLDDFGVASLPGEDSLFPLYRRRRKQT